ncbi:hypothetical protein TWF481_011602 [Arthrobotrys musiformis]|uniref:F-box domain-containing protein n=1 Tax=Arthrobotrys musiformis TaxID=47236 RepID=A0AAV9W0N8_9PEZI
MEPAMPNLPGLPRNSAAPELEASNAQVPQQSPLLNLPLDIFLPICEHAGLKAQIALSLTTKRLRYLSPPKENLSFGDSLCVSQIYRQFIPPRVIKRAHPGPRFSLGGTSSDSDPEGQTRGIDCQFCLQPLCSPRCSSALFLDVGTGVFFPASLYPVSRAELLCYPDQMIKEHEFGRNLQRGGPNAFGRRVRYSTIWCEHHRCPRDIFTKSNPTGKKTGKSALAKEKTRHVFEKLKISSSKPAPFDPEEKLKFEQDLHDELGYHRRRNEISRVWMGGRFFVGYRSIPGSPAPSIEPVYERFFYDILCRHCLHLHLRDQPRRTIIPTKSWSDYYIGEYGCACNWTGILNTSGCGTCGISTVKFTQIDAFDPTTKTGKLAGLKERYPFYLATDCRIELEVGAKRPGKVEDTEPEVNEYDRWKDIAWRKNGFRPVDEHDVDHEIQRIVPRLPEMVEKHLKIVRGDILTGMPPPGNVRISDLPYPVLKRILVYVLGEDGDGVMEKKDLAACLRAGYSLFKAWYGEDAVWSAREWMKQEVRDMNRGFYM